MAGLDAVLVAEDVGHLVGFVELSLRPWTEGCRSGRVGGLEGWSVEAGIEAAP